MAASSLHVMMIGPGSGGEDGTKFLYLKNKGIKCEVLGLPEPTEGDYEAMEKGIEILKQRLEPEDGKIIPDVIIGSSRGGKYIGELLNRKVWKGPILLISAMGTRFCCESNTEGAQLLICHGTKDGTNPIYRVRADVEQCSTAKLIEYEDNHSLHILVNDDLLAGLIQQCYEMKLKKPLSNVQPVRPSMGSLFSQIRKRG